MIAISNMEKPKSCEECPIRTAEIVGVYYDSKSDEYKRVKITGCDEAKYHTKTLGEGYKMLYKDCPLIDIVRCKECKYSGENEFIKGDTVCTYHIGHTYYTEADRFCCYGERRE